MEDLCSLSGYRSLDKLTSFNTASTRRVRFSEAMSVTTKKNATAIGSIIKLFYMRLSNSIVLQTMYRKFDNKTPLVNGIYLHVHAEHSVSKFE